MLESLNPFQQLIVGVTGVGVLMIILVILLTARPNFANTDRFKKILDYCQNNERSVNNFSLECW